MYRKGLGELTQNIRRPFLKLNLVFKKDFSDEVIKVMDDPSGPQEITKEMKATSCRQEMNQEMEDPLSVLFNNTWLSEAEPKWWMSFEENLIKLGPYEGGIDLLEKFDVVEVDIEKRNIVIHVTEFRWLNYPDFPDEVEKRDDFDRITLKGKTMTYEHKFESNEKVTTTWIAE
jgi:hypothetical protein